MTHTIEYTKQEVQAFLETTTDRNNNLIDALTRKGYKVSTNGKRGANLRFILDKELKVEADPVLEEFGFKPKRPEYTRMLIKVLVEDFNHNCGLTWNALSEYIETKYGVVIAPQHLSTAYSELVQQGTALNLRLSDREYLKKDGTKATDEEVEVLRFVINGFVAQGVNPWIARQIGMTQQGLGYYKHKQLSKWVTHNC